MPYPLPQTLKRIIAILLLVFQNSVLTGQETGIAIFGNILDAITGEPVENVNIVLSGTFSGTTTNSQGQFRLQAGRIPFKLEFTHVSYEPVHLEFHHIPLQPIRILLTRRTEPLAGVIITSRKIDTLYSDPVYSVLDYELTGRGILLLVFKARLSRAELLLKDYTGEKLLELSVLPMKPLGLFKDCLGEIHILSDDHAFQVAIQEDKLRLYDPYAMDYFTEVMSGCKFRIGEKVYFEVYQYNELIKKFYYVLTSDTTSHLLAMVADSVKIEFLRQNPENFSSGSMDAELSLTGQLRGTMDDIGTLNLIRNLDNTRRFNKMAYLSRIYAPSFAMNDSILIFNHPGDVIGFYNTSDSLIGETKIGYHHQAGGDGTQGMDYSFMKPSRWMEEIYVDEIRNKAYTVFQLLNGTKDLMEINLRTGAITRIMNIPFPYVQKIKIRDGSVYFVYKGFGENQKKKLFRQRIQ